jgi:16S rRNA (guanine966-N2)-methyltransferase
MAHEIRIIGGQWKRTKLAVADKPGLRPTPDRVRETLFNWLGQDLTGWRCIDVFAGTGALGFEAASRGAAEVQLFEQDTALVAQLRHTLQRLSAHAVRVQRGDGIAGLKARAPGSADLIFLDPPFDANLFDAALAASVSALAAEAGSIWRAPPLGTMQRCCPWAWQCSVTSRPAQSTPTCCGAWGHNPLQEETPHEP